MLLNFLELVDKYNIHVKGCVSIGGHFGEEYEDYIEAGIKKIVFIEPCNDSFNILNVRLGGKDGVTLIKCACGEIEEERVMYTGSQNEGQSNSLLKMEKHLQIHKGITLPTTEMVQVKRLDNLGVKDDLDFKLLVMDCQGFEGQILKGATETLKHIDYVYTEANKDEVYSGNTRIEELDSLLHEFTRVETGTWVGNMWTDCFYVRATLLN
ncbi:MAG: FkbM family methyltransferase [Ferruginibacter sp.]